MSTLKAKREAKVEVVKGKAPKSKLDRKTQHAINIGNQFGRRGGLSYKEARKEKRAKARAADDYQKPKRPPEPVIFAWFDWAKTTGNLIHCGRRKFKYRFSTFTTEIVGVDKAGNALVRIPLSLALNVFGKA